jgi:hypothetical protein
VFNVGVFSGTAPTGDTNAVARHACSPSVALDLGNRFAENEHLFVSEDRALNQVALEAAGNDIGQRVVARAILPVDAKAGWVEFAVAVVAALFTKCRVLFKRQSPANVAARRDASGTHELSVFGSAVNQSLGSQALATPRFLGTKVVARFVEFAYVASHRFWSLLKRPGTFLCKPTDRSIARLAVATPCSRAQVFWKGWLFAAGAKSAALCFGLSFGFTFFLLANVAAAFADTSTPVFATPADLGSPLGNATNGTGYRHDLLLSAIWHEEGYTALAANVKD